tara:strand:+ start:33 stop:434 length:402 start_codon:yes stop_codon:yes gene_type:complete
LKNIKVGYEIPVTNIGPFNQNDLVKYAKASGDFNPIHLDKEFAKKMGLDNVIVHGMLIMAHLGKSIAKSNSVSFLKHFSVQFCSITRLEEKLICKGEVLKIEKNNQKKIITLKLKVLNLSSEVKILGNMIFLI